MVDGTISAKAGHEIAKVKNPVVQKELAAKVVSAGLPAAKIAAEVRQKRGKAAPKRDKPIKLTPLTVQWTYQLEELLHVHILANHAITREEAVFTLERTLEELRTRCVNSTRLTQELVRRGLAIPPALPI